MNWKSAAAAESQHKHLNWGLESPRWGSAKPRGAVTCSTFILERNQPPGIIEGCRDARKFLPNSFQCSFQPWVWVQMGEGGGDMRQRHRSTANPGISTGLELNPHPWSLVLLGGRRMLRFAQPTRCKCLNPRGDADVLGSLRDGQASCFINPSSHFQRLANSSGREARPWEHPGRMELHHNPQETQGPKPPGARSLEMQQEPPGLLLGSSLWLCHQPAAAPAQPLCVLLSPLSWIMESWNGLCRKGN